MRAPALAFSFLQSSTDCAKISSRRLAALPSASCRALAEAAAAFPGLRGAAPGLPARRRQSILLPGPWRRPWTVLRRLPPRGSSLWLPVTFSHPFSTGLTGNPVPACNSFDGRGDARSLGISPAVKAVDSKFHPSITQSSRKFQKNFTPLGSSDVLHKKCMFYLNTLANSSQERGWAHQPAMHHCPSWGAAVSGTRSGPSPPAAASRIA